MLADTDTKNPNTKMAAIAPNFLESNASCTPYPANRGMKIIPTVKNTLLEVIL